MIYQIPIISTHCSFTQEVVLEGVTYSLLLRWNEREEVWYMTISDIEGVIILASRKLVAGVCFFRYCTDMALRPPGELMFDGVATRDNLTTNDVWLFYVDADDYV
jgi:hypothetical protein